MTSELVLRTHRNVFNRALLEQDWDVLVDLYANNYMLVRSDGSVLTKDGMLNDLRNHNLTFESIELTNEKVRIIGSVAIVTGQSRSTSRHAGTLVQSCFRLIAVYVEVLDGLELLHFRSTAVENHAAFS